MSISNFKRVVLLILLIITSTGTIFFVRNILNSRQLLKPKASDLDTLPLVRGRSGDLWADIIIGQPNFNETTEWATVGDKVWVPGGAIVDRSTTPNKLYVWDAGNNRILGFNLDKCLNKNPQDRCRADLVIGQPNTTSAACNGDSAFQNHPQRAPSSATSLCGIEETEKSPGEGAPPVSMDVDDEGNLYVPDFFNNRVLKFIRPFETDVVADEVWGQDDFTGNLPNKGNGSIDGSTLNFGANIDLSPAGVDIDDDGYVWVSDKRNNRVLRFPPREKTADLVFGQNSFSEAWLGNSLNRLNRPGAVRVIGKEESKKVYVADNGNSRVLLYQAPFSNGMAATVFGSGFSRPSGIDPDPMGQGIWINDPRDAGKGLLELWNFEGTQVLKIIGAESYVPYNNGDSNYQAFSNPYFAEHFGSLGLDKNGNVCLTTRYNDLFCFKAPFNSFGTAREPDVKFFSPPLGSNFTNRNEIGSVKGIAVSNNQLIVADYGRVLYWDNPSSLSSGTPASGVINDDPSNNFPVRNNETDFQVRSRFWDHNLTTDRNNHLYIINGSAGYLENILVYNLPLAVGNTPFKKITFPIPVLGGGTYQPQGNFEVSGIAVTDNGQFMYLGESDASRVVRIRNPLTEPVLDMVIGQDNLTEKRCNKGLYSCSGHWCAPPLNDPSRTASSLCLPGAVTLDSLGNLYISDNSIETRGNKRLMKYDRSLLPTNNTSIVYGISSSVIIDRIEANKPAFDSQNRMIVGFNPFRNIFDAGLNYCPVTPGIGACGFIAYYTNFQSTSVPDGFFRDYYTQPYTMTFDNQDNLYVGDMNRARVLVYQKPFQSISPALTPAPTTGCVRSNGDADKIGGVTINDYAIWRGEFLGVLLTQSADFDCQNGVTINDYQIWRSNFLPQ